MKETDVEEIYEAIREREEMKEKDTITRVPINVKVWLAGGFGLIVLFIIIGYITLKVGIIVGIIGLLALKFIYGDISEGRELSERELAAILYNNLKYDQTHSYNGVYRIEPHLVVRIERAGRRVRYNGVPQERRFLVSFFDTRTQKKEWWEYAVDLYTGDTCKAKLLTGGPRQFDTKDIEIIVSKEVREQQRLQKELGSKSKM